MNDFFIVDSEFDKDEIKKNLTLSQIAAIVEELGGEPQVFNNYLIAKTICHNTYEEEASHKLYYYENTKLFHCYTSCGTFDIYELVCKVKNINNQYKVFLKDGKYYSREWELFDAIPYIINFLNLSAESYRKEKQSYLQDWDYLNKIQKNNIYKYDQIVEMKYYDNKVLKHLPRPHIKPWEDEGISYDIILKYGIAYDPINHGIIIPHYDKDNNLLGIRIRTLIKEDEIYGKYRPAFINGQLYNHPLGFNLYNLNNSKKNIQKIKKVFVFEGEKGPLTYASLFGSENDIAVAVCGSNFSDYQFNLLKDLGVEEIIIAFDKQFEEYGNSNYKKWIKKLQDIKNRFGNEIQISFMFDTDNLLGFKESPIDRGKEIFLKLYEKRLFI